MTLVTNDLPLQTKAAQRVATCQTKVKRGRRGPTAQINLSYICSSPALTHSFAVTFLMTLGWL